MNFGVGSGSDESQSTTGTGATTSLSFVPALLANAFYGTDIGISEGGFQILGGDEDLDGAKLFESLKGYGFSKSQVAQILGDRERVSALNLGGDSILNPANLVSNITDLANPDINPAISGALRGLGLGEEGIALANQLLGGDIIPTLQEGLATGFKPDLQPIVDEAKRGFFQDIVPQLGQNNVALQEGVGPFSTDLSGQLLQAGTDLQSRLGGLEVGLQEGAADRRSGILGMSNLFTNQLFNANTDAGRNQLALGEQIAQLGTTGGRQASMLQMLTGQVPSNPIQASSSQQASTGRQFNTDAGILSK